jgi:hypothetical protein
MIWTAIVVQFAGYVFDALWHGLISPGVEPHTVDEMAWHLVTVHLPLYVGALAVLVTTGLALRQRSRTAAALPIAFAGAVISVAGEAWHAVSHLRLDTQHAPVAGRVSFVGFVVVVVAMIASRRARRRPVSAARDEQRAA